MSDTGTESFPTTVSPHTHTHTRNHTHARAEAGSSPPHNQLTVETPGPLLLSPHHTTPHHTTPHTPPAPMPRVARTTGPVMGHHLTRRTYGSSTRTRAATAPTRRRMDFGQHDGRSARSGRRALAKASKASKASQPPKARDGDTAATDDAATTATSGSPPPHVGTAVPAPSTAEEDPFQFSQDEQDEGDGGDGAGEGACVCACVCVCVCVGGRAGRWQCSVRRRTEAFVC